MTPIEQIKLSVDYWDIKIEQDIVSASELVDLGVPLQSLQFNIVRGPPVPLQQVQANGSLASALTPVGLILAQDFPYVNATQTEVNGIDVDLASHVDVGVVGKLSASLNYTHMFHYYLTAPGRIYLRPCWNARSHRSLGGYRESPGSCRADPVLGSRARGCDGDHQLRRRLQSHRSLDWHRNLQRVGAELR